MTGRLLHGGGLLAAEERFGRPAAGWLDLSTGISPWPYPLPRLSAAVWRRLPEPEEIAALERTAATAYGAVDPACVVAAPGAQALIQWLPRLRSPGRVGIIGFTYGEHARCWAQAGHRVETVETLDRAGDCDVLILVNPNNPDGRLVPCDAVMGSAAALARRGGLLIVDESFADVVPGSSVAGEADAAGLCVLRSFGKTYGLAGVRLGFAVAPRELAMELRRVLGPWAVSGAAVAVGMAALTDGAWRTRMVERLTAAAGRLDRMLGGAGLHVVGGTPLFRLAAVPGGAASLYASLACAGILTRNFPEEPAWLRIGIPGTRAAERRLAAALQSTRRAGAADG